MNRFAGRRLPGLHISMAVWLPPPAENWPGWLRTGPREFAVHPLAREAFLEKLQELLGGVQVLSPEQTDTLTARVAREQLAKEEAAKAGQAVAAGEKPRFSPARRVAGS